MDELKLVCIAIIFVSIFAATLIYGIGEIRYANRVIRRCKRVRDAIDEDRRHSKWNRRAE